MSDNNITRTDIWNNVADNRHHFKKYPIKNQYDIKLARRFLSLYFMFMWNAVLNGHKWTLPVRFGKLYIDERLQTKSRKVPGYLKPYVKTEYVQNTRTPGIVYKIVIDGKFFTKYKMRFRAAKSIRSRLRVMINNYELNLNPG